MSESLLLGKVWRSDDGDSEVTVLCDVTRCSLILPIFYGTRRFMTLLTTACHLRSALFWGITQRRMAIFYQRLWASIGYIFLTLDDGTDTVSRNVGKGLPFDAA